MNAIPKAWTICGYRAPGDTEWTKAPGAPLSLVEVRGVAAAGTATTRQRRDGRLEVLEIKERR